MTTRYKTVLDGKTRVKSPDIPNVMGIMDFTFSTIMPAMSPHQALHDSMDMLKQCVPNKLDTNITEISVTRWNEDKS